MSDKPPPALTSDDAQALRWLIKFIKPGQWVTLARLLKEAKDDTGFGVVKILVIDRRPEKYRLEKMYE